MMGLIGGAGSLGRIVIPMISGYLGTDINFIVAGCMALLGGLCVCFLSEKK